MVEFSLLLPLFVVIIFATIDFSGYFGARLSVENAARQGARTAVVQPLTAYPAAATTIQNTVIGFANDANMPSNVDCHWNGATLSPTVYPPFSWTSGRGCIGIWYFELGQTGSPSLCAQWSLQNSEWGTWTLSGSTWSFAAASAPTSPCVTAGNDVVVVGVGYTYSPLTPVPALSGLNTYGETQLLEED
jgi:hypothetical protein